MLALVRANRFSFNGHIEPKHPILAILKRFCGNFTLISAQTSTIDTSSVEYAYQLMVRNANKNEEMLTELEKINGIKDVSLTMQEQLLEV